ncbi:TPA: hypothetical protein ACS78H_001390, partial [Providencia alcalifaciens]
MNLIPHSKEGAVNASLKIKTRILKCGFFVFISATFPWLDSTIMRYGCCYDDVALHCYPLGVALSYHAH